MQKHFNFILPILKLKCFFMSYDMHMSNPFNCTITTPFIAPAIVSYDGWIYNFDAHTTFATILFDELTSHEYSIQKSTHPSSSYMISDPHTQWSGIVSFGTEDGFIRCYIRRTTGDPIEHSQHFMKVLRERLLVVGIQVMPALPRMFSTRGRPYNCPIGTTELPALPALPAHTPPAPAPAQLTLPARTAHTPPAPAPAQLTLPEIHIDNSTTTTPRAYICPHCEGPSSGMNAPLTCGCSPCSCACPKWSSCPQIH
jgi:hypothetical protein